MSIGSRIRQARKSQRVSQRTLAEIVGVSAMAISKYERDLMVPSSGILLQLAGALNLRVEYFFRPLSLNVTPQIYRKHSSLGAKQEAALVSQIQEWLERYLETESLFNDEIHAVDLPYYHATSMNEVERAAESLRMEWDLGFAPIENLIQVFEDNFIAIGLVQGFEHFNACTLRVNGAPVIATRHDIPGDRQRFNLAHELGHLVLQIHLTLDPEKAAHRFAGAFLVPEKVARRELGSKRKKISDNELHLLKHKYGLSMQAWIYRAQDLGIITQSSARRIFHIFRKNGWHRREPGRTYSPEKPSRLRHLVLRALAEDIISRSRAEDLLGEPLEDFWYGQAQGENNVVVGIGS